MEVAVLEQIVVIFEDISKQLDNIHKRILELEFQQEDDLLLTIDDLKEFMQFKSYGQIKSETQKVDFPKVLIGNTERYPKKLVVEYYNDLARQKVEKKEKLVFKGEKSALYEV
jgi:hypothetical protein